MNNPLTNHSNQPLIDQAGDAAADALAATQRTANEALNSLAQAVQTLRDEAQRTADRVTDRTSGLIRHDPLKAVLIAAATGAALMALAGWLGRSHHSR
jgi:ElaB/YqjD/DUF883 family membrane-anchored ribosome-binding protein